MRRVLLAGALALAAVGGARAGDKIPWDGAVAGGYVRPNPNDIWQMYAVDNYGRFRPRVAEFPDGLRYVYNGAPFPWGVNYPHHAARGAVTRPATFDEAPRPGAVRVIGFAPLTSAWERMPHAGD